MVRAARWSSLVARRAHNPKVGGSNPPRATNVDNALPHRRAFPHFGRAEDRTRSELRIAFPTRPPDRPHDDELLLRANDVVQPLLGTRQEKSEQMLATETARRAASAGAAAQATRVLQEIYISSVKTCLLPAIGDLPRSVVDDHDHGEFALAVFRDRRRFDADRTHVGAVQEFVVLDLVPVVNFEVT
jgi:hypothetical protein